MSEVMINVSDLRKHYGDFEALKGISFSIPKGQVVGFLGPNGAGKTTTMKIITGYLAPTSGAIVVNGLDAYEHSLEVRNRIGYLPENNPLYSELVVYDFLRFAADMRGIPKTRADERIKEVGGRCGLQEVIGRTIGELSKGLRQRVGLAQALLHDPPLLILDEPTSGLDPNQIVEIRNLIRELGKDHTVILSTHNLPEVMQVCSRLVIIHRGTIVADGTPGELQQRELRSASIVLEVQKNGTSAEDMGERIKGTVDVRELSHEEGDGVVRIKVRPGPEHDPRNAIFRLASEEGWAVNELYRDVLDIEGIFHRLTQD
jgi:ABC-2 type transport system ATP-binding protein